MGKLLKTAIDEGESVEFAGKAVVALAAGKYVIKSIEMVGIHPSLKVALTSYLRNLGTLYRRINYIYLKNTIIPKNL